MPKSEIKPVNVLIRPRVTEKAALASSKSNVHVFEVSEKATRRSVSESVKQAFEVTPEKVRLLSISKKQIFRRGKKGVKGGGKKAYVYLKKGDKIEIA
ncbi:MAG: 50S ribosomal protein L23 [Patescibacteria group bacterium]